jgi:hypothetical protein
MRTLPLLLASLVCVPAQGVKWPELRGIVHVDGAERPAAILTSAKPVNLPEIKTAPGPQYSTILHVGQTDAGLDAGNIEVAAIDPAAGVVRLLHRTSSETTEVKLAGPSKGEKYLLHLERAPLAVALACYQRLSGRTIVHSPQLPNVEVDIHIPADQDKKAALATLAKAVEVHETAIIEHDQKFAFAVPDRHKQLIASLPAITPANPTADPKHDALIPAGLIKFASADVRQVIEFYSDLSERTVLRPDTFPHSQVTLRSQAPLSRAEATWMIEAALHLCGLTAIPTGDKFVYVVPPQRAKDLPTFDPARKLPGETGLINLVQVDRVPLLEMYAALTGRKALPIEPTVPHAKFSLRLHTPLTPAEAAFALEAIAMLNGLAVQPTGRNEVTLVPLALARLKTN